MSVATDLQNVYKNLSEGLRDCREALVEKGVEGLGSTVWGVGRGIRQITDGRDLVPVITRQITNFVATSDLYMIGPYGFAGCQNLRTVDFSALDDVHLFDHSFYNCTSLIEVIFPDSIGSMVSCPYCFSNCTSLTEITVPVVGGSVSERIFSGCTSLQKVNFKEGLTGSVPAGLFENCTNINNIILPSTLTNKIYGNAFKNCSSLDTLVLKSNSLCALVSTTAFNGTPIASGTGYIYVPSALVPEYQSATNWTTYASQFRAIEDYPDIVGG